MSLFLFSLSQLLSKPWGVTKSMKEERLHYVMECVPACQRGSIKSLLWFLAVLVHSSNCRASQLAPGSSNMLGSLCITQVWWSINAVKMVQWSKYNPWLAVIVLGTKISWKYQVKSSSPVLEGTKDININSAILLRGQSDNSYLSLPQLNCHSII